MKNMKKINKLISDFNIFPGISLFRAVPAPKDKTIFLNSTMDEKTATNKWTSLILCMFAMNLLYIQASLYL